MSIDTVLFGLLIGLLGGFAGGLLGIGGGAIYVPAMVLFLGEDQHVAQGASLAAIVATGLAGGLTHLRHGNVDLPVVWLVAPVAVATGFGAALLADVLEPEVLRRIFAVVAGYMAITMIVGAVRARRAPATAREGS
jgi:hypothetical protein